MTTDSNILTELQSISPTLAGISRRMPYAVPDNYFEYLADRMLIEVTPAPQTGDVPEGYFDQFADNMLQLIREQNASQELNEIAPTLMSINRSMPYHVPTGYFDQLSAPNLEENELAHIAPTFFSIERKMPYEVPAGYFEQLTPALPQPAKVVSMTSKKMWWRMAVAAVLLIGGFSIWQLSNNGSNTSSTGLDVATLAADTVAIPQEISLQLANLDASTLESAFAETEQTSSHTQAAYLLETDNFEQALQSVTTEAISDQLDKIPVTQKNI